MALVEESASYLDGAGREEARQLRRAAAMAYATESMRLTTRLMQLASWLLLQRAVNEGQMTHAQATSERHKVRLARQEVACAPELFEELPQRLRDLSLKSLRLQARIIHLDYSLAMARAPEIASGAEPDRPPGRAFTRGFRRVLRRGAPSFRDQRRTDRRSRGAALAHPMFSPHCSVTICARAHAKT